MRLLGLEQNYTNSAFSQITRGKVQSPTGIFSVTLVKLPEQTWQLEGISL